MYKSAVIDYFQDRMSPEELRRSSVTSRIAAELDCTYQNVHGWGEIIPEVAALRLHILTDGKLKFDASLYRKTAA